MQSVWPSSGSARPDGDVSRALHGLDDCSQRLHHPNFKIWKGVVRSVLVSAGALQRTSVQGGGSRAFQRKERMRAELRYAGPETTGQGLPAVFALEPAQNVVDVGREGVAL